MDQIKRKKQQKPLLYCSLDIETSDFNAETGEVIEIGMVFFTLEKTGLKIIKEWESAFKSLGEVSPRILALTGIRTEELDKAPLFKDKRDELQEMLTDCVIVGHNVSFDIGFLKKHGLKFSARQLDTLDLAQIFLPTATSYNLEAVMNLLEVGHNNAHRALADAKASLVVLERLVQYYCSFPKKMRDALGEIFIGKAFAEIRVLLECELEPKIPQFKEEKAVFINSAEVAKALKQKNAIISFPLGFDHHRYVYGALRSSAEKILLICPSKKEIYKLWRSGIVEPYFDAGEIFAPKKFEAFAKRAKTFEEKCFAAKITVWLGTNWQARAITDLNCAVSGNQFKQFISYSNTGKKSAEKKSGKAKPEAVKNLAGGSDSKEISDKGNTAAKNPQLFDKNKKIIAIDCYEFISSPVLSADLLKRKIVALDINKFENILTLASGKKISWKEFSYIFKQAYFGPENEERINGALALTDLFFGLASMNFKKLNAESGTILIDGALRKSEMFQNLEQAARNFLQKAGELNESLGHPKITELLNDLESFFIEDPALVYWADMYENHFAFHTGPKELAAVSKAKLQKFKNIIFTAALGSRSLIRYFKDRLALENIPEVVIGQGELAKEFDVVIPRTNFAPAELLKLVSELESPAALLLPNQNAIRDFYEQNFVLLQERYKVFVQGYSGGTTKILENFANKKNGLFIATDRFVLKQNNASLKVKTLVITRLPFEQFNHPLYSAQAAKYADPFLEFTIPKALHNFHCLISFFYGPDLKTVYILDQKIHKEYGKYFLEYLKALPFVVLK